MSRDFFDEDLLDGAPAGADAAPAAAPEAAGKPAHLGRQKDELNRQVAGASQELELLKRRQQELEREKAALEKLGRKQQEYEEKKELATGKLTQGLAWLEREAAQAARMVELFAETRTRFSELLKEVESIEEATWREVDFGEELEQALEVTERALENHSKGMARIEATSWHKSARKTTASAGADAAFPVSPPRRWGFWQCFVAGLAASLPLALCLGALLFLYLHFMGRV